MRAGRAGYRAAVLAAALSQAACASGSLSEGFGDPALAESYISLEQVDRLSALPGGAAFVVAPNIAVTNAHNANLIAPGDNLAQSETYDLLFFRTDRTQPVRMASPRLGMMVVAYGNGGGDERREVTGPIESLPVTREECVPCPENVVFGYRAPAGPGYSGGPVVNAVSGAVVGITFAYIDAPLESGLPRLMLAYDAALIRAELDRLIPRINE